MKKIYIFIYLIPLISLVWCILKVLSGTGIAPHGIHGHYSSGIYDPNYETTVSMDSILTVLKKDEVIIKSGRLNDYDPPWDSLRYVLGNITCDNQKIEAYIEFKDKKAKNTTFEVVWFKALPTEDDEEYEKRVKIYYKCFEALLKKHNLIKQIKKAS